MRRWTPVHFHSMRVAQIRGESTSQRGQHSIEECDIALWVKLGRSPERACDILNGIARPVLVSERA